MTDSRLNMEIAKAKNNSQAVETSKTEAAYASLLRAYLAKKPRSPATASAFCHRFVIVSGVERLVRQYNQQYLTHLLTISYKNMSLVAY